VPRLAERAATPRPDRALLERAAAGRDVVRYAAGDPELVLSNVVWPTDELLAAQLDETPADAPAAAPLTAAEHLDAAARAMGWNVGRVRVTLTFDDGQVRRAKFEPIRPAPQVGRNELAKKPPRLPGL
jgi:hypothetical protein